MSGRGQMKKQQAGIPAGKFRCRMLVGVLALTPMLLAAGCAESAQSRESQRKAVEAATKTAEYRAAARSALGRESEVILSGDLARNGHIQLLVVEPLPKTPQNAAAGTMMVSRAAILEQDGTDWREIFLADEQLKNTEGFLGGTPRDAVNAWKLDYQQPATGLTMFFTPLDQGGGQSSIEVRWNTKESVYQSLDRATRRFLAESTSLGPRPEFEMKP